MKRNSWQDRLIGVELPAALANIEWEGIFDSEQEVGEESMGNVWCRERNTRAYWDEKRKKPKLITEYIPGFVMWTTLLSQYREAVHLPVFVTVNEDGKVDYIEIEAYVSYGPNHGPPGYINVQQREGYQVGRLLKELYKEK